MIELQVLGSAEVIRGAESVRLSPKPLAVVTYLVLAEPRSFVRRDTLLGVFWPEFDQHRARTSLRQALYYLRKTLGEGVVRTRGEDDVGVDRERLTCDALAFDAAVQAGDLETAVSLYHGPLLSGVYVSGCPEFENWLDGERGSRHRAYGESLERLAAAAEAVGDHARAAHWLRRRARADPHSGRVAILLMTALEAAGERAAAIRAGEQHVELVRRELEAEPEPKVLDVLKQLRTRPPIMDTPRLAEAGDEPPPSPELDAIRAALAPQYRILEELGSGGMAAVYLADDGRHQRKVAVKVLNPDYAALVGPERFLREIAIAADLYHPHIVPLIDSGQAGPFLYYVMPFVGRETLRARLRRERKLKLPDAVRIATDVASALAYAHGRGIVHRDIKPENILLHEGEGALVADFGIALALSRAGGTRVTETGLMIGTPEYMSPEQAGGERDIDGRSDVYSLACVLYEMLAGEPVYTGATSRDVMAKHMLERVPSVRIARPTVSAGLAKVIETALAKDPADRFGTAAAFVDALSAAHAGSGRRPLWSRPRALGAVGATVLVIALLPVWIGRPSSFRVTEQDWVFVADFEGPADEPSLADAVRDLVTAKLEQSTFIRTVPRDLVTNAKRDAAIPDTVRLDASLARELAFRTSVRVVLAGSISRLGRDAYSLVLHVIDVDDGAHVFSAATSALDRGDQLVKAVEQLGQRVRVGLGERRELVEAERPLMRARTPSFEAFRKFSDAIGVMRRGNWAGSNVLLKEAVSIDTAFAAAWAVMAMNYVTSRQPDSATLAFQQALRYPDRLSEAELYRLRGDMAYSLDHDPHTAALWYDAYLQSRPTSIAARNNRALYLSSLGRHEEAAAEFAAAAMIDPLHKGPRQIQLLNLTAELVVLGELDSAAAVANRLTGAPAQYAEVLLLGAQNNWPAVASRARDYATNPSTEPFVQLPATTSWAAARAAQGAVEEAASVLKRAAATSSGGQARWYQRALLLLAMVSEQPVIRIEHAVRDTSAGAGLLDGLLAAARGDTLDAAQALRLIRALDEHELRPLGYGPAFLEALISYSGGRWARVVDALREPAAKGEHDPFSLDRVGSLSLRWTLAHAYAQAGDLDSAVAVMERVLDGSGLSPSHYALRGIPYAFAHRSLAIWNWNAGRVERARFHWQRFVETFTTPSANVLHLLQDPTAGRLSQRV